MRIAVVNDLLLAVEALRRVVCSIPDYSLAWVARDGAEAVKKCQEDRPDLILMDLLMPVMDGVEATRQIMQQSPCAILVVTSTIMGNLSKVYEAMGHGALDAVNTPVLSAGQNLQGGVPILEKMDRIARMLRERAIASSGRSAPPRPVHRGKRPSIPMLAIGASTGGPQALAEILTALPADFPGAILICQHIAADFAPGLADWLADRTKRPVKLAKSGDRPVAGTAFLAGTDDHLYERDPIDNFNRPSVDVLFNSLATNWGEPAVGVLLTGMGKDGALGLLRLKQSGWHTIAQDEKSCVVFGMPQAAIQLGAASNVLPLDKIAAAVMARLSGTPKQKTLP